MKKIKVKISNSLYSIRITYLASRKFFILQFITSFLIAFLSFANIYVWRNVINCLTDISKYHLEFLISNFLVFVLLYLIKELLSRANENIMYRYNDRVSVYVENTIIDKCADVDLSFYDSSELNDRLSQSTSIMYSIMNVSSTVFYILRFGISFIFSAIILSSLNIWYVLLILVACVPIFINNMKVQMSDIKFRKNNANTERRMEYYKKLFKNVDNGFDIRLFSLKDFFLSKYINAWSDWFQNRKKLSFKTLALTFINLFISSFVNLILLYAIIIKKLSSKVMKIGDALYYISIFNQFYDSVESLMSSIGYFSRITEELQTVRDFLEFKPSVHKSGVLEPGDFADITFDHVNFCYPGKSKYVLYNCCFTIKKGETVGLVGENGSGKSTIVKLLLRFYDVSGGRILIDGKDIKDYDLVKYRKKFSVLFQDFLRYRMTLRDNIALSDYDNLSDDNRIRNAIEKSELIDVVNGWDKGLETSLTRHFNPDGKELSGGQWQRIALARVFFSNRDFVILDEPSASLDVFAEEKIFEHFTQLSKNRSSLIISHRLSSIVNADSIIVLKDGAIIEQGSHKELVSNREGYYTELFNLQASRYDTKNLEY